VVVVVGAKRDGDGYLWITGRIDDMLNVSGHLLSTADVESVLIEHPLVAETAVVAHPHSIKGECLYCFVTVKDVSVCISSSCCISSHITLQPCYNHMYLGSSDEYVCFTQLLSFALT